jgi:hypothetical protein
MMANNIPGWGPTKPLIVSDPSKLSYFAKANMIRGGMGGVAASSASAAFGDLAGGRSLNGWTAGVSGLGNAVQAQSASITPGRGSSMESVGAGQVPQGGQTVASWLDGFGTFIRGVVGGSNPADMPPPPTMETRADDTVLGIPRTAAIIGGVVVGGLVIYKLLK